MAKERLQGAMVQGRPVSATVGVHLNLCSVQAEQALQIDVHYSLPKEEEAKGKCGPDKNQGSLFVHIRGMSQPFSEHLLRQRLIPFGDIKSLQLPLFGGRPECASIHLIRIIHTT